MAEEEQKHHHHFFHHHRDEESPSEVDPKKEEKHHKHKEHLGELGALAAGAYALVSHQNSISPISTSIVIIWCRLAIVGGHLVVPLAQHEKHQAKKDPENAHKHKVAEEIAATVAVGSAGFAFHEHHEKKEAKKHACE